MAFRLGPEEEQSILKGMRVESQRKATIESQVNPQTAQNISEIRQKYPWLPPGVILAAAKGDVSEELLATMAASIAIMANDDPEKANGKKKGNWLSNGFKAVTRPVFAGFDTAYELLQNAVSKTPIPAAAEYVGAKVQGATGQLEGGYGAGIPSATQVFSSVEDRKGEGGWTDFIGSTTLASLIRNWDEQGSGYFVSENIRQEQAERARKFRGTTQGGHAWTIGRGGAGMVFTEDSYAYNLMSGVIDGYVAIKLPVAPGAKLALKGVSELASADDAGEFLQQAGRVADTLQGKGQVLKISDMTGEDLKEARRLAGLVGDTVDATEANRFFGTRAGRRLVQRLVAAESVDDVWKLLNRNVYADTVKRLRDAKTESEVQEVLTDVLGKPQVGLSTTKGAKGVRAFSISNARRLKIMESLDTKVGLKIKRGLGYTPGKMIDMSSSNPADVRRTLQQIDNWAKNTLVPEEARRALLDEGLDVMIGENSTPTARRAFKEKFENVTIRSLIDNGYTNQAAAEVIFAGHRSRMQKIRQWALGPDGVPDDAGLAKNVARVDGEEVTDVAFGGAMLSSELADVIIDMPDPRQVRAISNRFNWGWRKKPNIKGNLRDLPSEQIIKLAETGELRLPFAVMNFIQEQLFRRIVLMTGGYSVRNLTEAQIRIALSSQGIDGGFIHPLSWIGWVTHRKGGYDILGNKFDVTAETVQANMKTFREAVQAENFVDFSDPAETFRRGKRLGVFEEVDRLDPEDAERVIEAHGDQLGLLNADPVARRIAAGASDDEIITFLRTDPEGKDWFAGQQDYHINGRPTYSSRTGRRLGTDQIDLEIEDNLRKHIQEIRNRVDYHTGDDSRLRDVIAGGLLPEETLAVGDVRLAERRLGATLTKADEGQEVVLETMIPGSNVAGTRRVRVISVDEDTGEAVVRPFAFVTGRGEVTRDLNKLLEDDSVFYNNKLVQYLPHEIRVPKTGSAGRSMTDAWDDTTDRIFGFLYGKPSRYLDRSPIFRQFYYQTAIDQLLPALNSADVARLHANIVEAAAKTGVKPENYLGDGARWKRIEDAKDGKIPLKGSLTLEQVDDYAKGQALDDLKGLLYDATTRRNAVDAARVVFPFINAFAEFYKSVGRAYSMKTMTGIPLPNPASFRKTQLVVEGGRDGDPDKDGRGFFFTDPVTGEWSFMYPGSTLLTKAATGVAAGLTAPVSGALQGVDLGQDSMFGLKVNPGLGPFANMAASALFKVIPDSDFKAAAEKFLMPYGGTEISAETGGAAGVFKPLVPAWANKVISVLDSETSTTAFANNLFQTKQALLASGKYDANNPEDMRDLDADANFKAKFLTVMQAAGQFLGPSRPTPEFKIKAMDGDVYMNQAIADYRRWSEEDPDSALLRLLDTYGEDFWALAARKTTAEPFEAIDATREFAGWESGNKAFVKQFPTVAGYFAPVGTEFDYFVYSDQLGRLRRRMSNLESFNRAQAYSVQAQMRLAQRLVGDNPTTEVEEELARYRAALEKEYPGSKQVPFDPTKLQDQIAQLEQAAKMPEMNGNPIAEGTRIYLQQRASIMAAVEASGKSIKNKDNVDARNALRGIATIVISEYPDFQRLWDRVLSRELD